MKFELAYDRLADFVKVSEKALGVPDVVSLYTDDNENLYLYCYTDNGFSYISFNNIQGSLSTAVEAEKFFVAIKNLYGDTLSFNYEKRKLLIKKDNIEVKLASSTRVLTAPTIPAYMVPPDRVSDLVKALKRASSIVQDDSRFFGVLVDNQVPFCRACNFSSAAITIGVLDFISEIPSGRIAITSQSVSTVGSLENQIESLFISEKNHFGFRTYKGTIVYMPTVVDSYPENYLEQLKLSNTVSPLNIGQFSATYFNKEHLLQAANLVSSIMGAEEATLKFTVKGVSNEGNPIWQISSRSFTQSEAQEIIEANPGSSIEEVTFMVSKKQFLKVLSQLDENVTILYSSEYSALVFYNNDGRDLVLLVKMV